MGLYVVTASGTTNGTGNTEDTWIEILPPANVAILLNRIRIFYDGGATAVADNLVSARVLRTSTAGATGVGGTIVKKYSFSPATVCTVNVKNGATAFSVGTVTDVINQFRFNERGFYEWIPNSEYEKIFSGINSRLAIVLKNQAASRVMVVEVEWFE